METWNSCTSKEPPQKRYDPDGCESYDYGNIQDLPIELRRVDDDEPPQRRQTFPSSQINTVVDLYGGIKSKSLTNIKTFEEKGLVRSQSSVPSLQDQLIDEEKETQQQVPSSRSLNKPKLVKQKQSICDEDAEEALDIPTDMKELVSTPEFRICRQRGVFKQRSMNEELLSKERLREKERVKRNIQKQASLNEELIYQRHALESIRESFLSVSTSKRFQLIKSGFTNIKNSAQIEKVTGTSLKNGFVRMFQGWKNDIPTQPEENEIETRIEIKQNFEEKKVEGERRHSKEDGSDSSKDSSLQSDTSVDSEDSFASVIFVPKPDQLSPTLSPGPTSPRLPPNSPRMKNASCPTSPRIKNMPLTVYPLTKQLSSPKPTTNSIISYKPTSPNIENILNSRGTKDEELVVEDVVPKVSTKNLAQKYSVVPIPKFKKEKEEVLSEDQKKRSERLRQIRDLLSQRPGFGVRNTRSIFPIVRHASTTGSESREPIARPLPKLLSLELFNPETDDKDSDSSGVSSPDSVDSVINIECSENNAGNKLLTRSVFFTCFLRGMIPQSQISDTLFLLGLSKGPEKQPEERRQSPTKFAFPPVIEETKESEDNSLENSPKPDLQQKLSPLLEAAANVCTSLDEAVDKVIQSSPRAKRKQFLEPLEPKDVLSVMERSYYNCEEVSPNCEEDTALIEASWDEECHRHLSDFADKLSEKLLQEIDQYQEASKKDPKEIKFLSSATYQHINDPYIHRLSEELDDLNKLSAEIQKQNEYLTFLSTYERKKGCRCPKKCTCNDLTSSKCKKQCKEDNSSVADKSGRSDLCPKCPKCTCNEVSNKCRKQCKCKEEHNIPEKSGRSEVVGQIVENSDLCPKCSKNSQKQCKCKKLSRQNSVETGSDIQIQINSEVVKKCGEGYKLSRQSSDSSDFEIRVPSAEGFRKCRKQCNCPQLSRQGSDSSDFCEIRVPSAEGFRKCRKQCNCPQNEVKLSRQGSDSSRCLDGLSESSGSVKNLRLSRESSDASDVHSDLKTSSSVATSLHFGHSIDSNDFSEKDTNSLSRFSDGGSTASLKSISAFRLGDGRSSSEEAQTQGRSSQEDRILQENFGSLNASLSDDTSQDSLPSDNIGGAITYHRYYHVFREGELDQLIEKYVENLHIISSYYDHASWCIVAEKVQVWTI